jgi:energy-coupling factor transport system ATP-binding protein
MKAIDMRDVSYTYTSYDADLVAVDRVSLSIEEREFVVLLGANGSGKSTVAKMMNGLLVPTSGTVTVYGDSTADETDEVIFRIRSTVGMVFQNPDNQMVASIIEDDVAFGPENLGVPHDEMVERVRWALEAVGMYAYRQHTPLKLSGGQKQRVAIASVLAMKPKVLVLDESTAMLDPMGRAEVMQVLHDLNRREGITVVLITHHMDECVGADRAVVMNGGHIAYDGKPQALFADARLVAACGLELPPVAEIASLLAAKGLPVDSGECDLNVLAEQICRLK